MTNSDFNLDFQNQHIESKIVASLERISHAFRVLVWQESKEYSLSPIQVQVLIFLLNHSEEKRKVTYLSDEFNMTKATISDTIKSLEEKELIRKEYEPLDTRSYVLHLTKKGNETAKKISRFTQEVRTPIEQLQKSEKEILFVSLTDIIRHLNQVGVITVQRMCMTCRFHQASGNGQKHFCKLLKQPLKSTELRLDCAEHEPKDIQIA